MQPAAPTTPEDQAPTLDEELGLPVAVDDTSPEIDASPTFTPLAELAADPLLLDSEFSLSPFRDSPWSPLPPVDDADPQPGAPATDIPASELPASCKRPPSQPTSPERVQRRRYPDEGPPNATLSPPPASPCASPVRSASDHAPPTMEAATNTTLRQGSQPSTPRETLIFEVQRRVARDSRAARDKVQLLTEMMTRAPSADRSAARGALLGSVTALAQDHVDVQERWWDQHDQHRQIRDLSYPEAVFATDRALRPFLELRPTHHAPSGQSVSPRALDIPRLQADLSAAGLSPHGATRAPVSSRNAPSHSVPNSFQPASALSSRPPYAPSASDPYGSLPATPPTLPCASPPPAAGVGSPRTCLHFGFEPFAALRAKQWLRTCPPL